MGKSTTSKEFIKRIGFRVRQIRKDEKRWTLEEAEKHGWPSWQHLQRIERGADMRLSTLWRLCKLF